MVNFTIMQTNINKENGIIDDFKNNKKESEIFGEL
tara:strand:+ start:1402 stop:1506 length:105 start_codon:yes stop_codon:yes gene_type:complete